jgi:hypothetical protein
MRNPRTAVSTLENTIPSAPPQSRLGSKPRFSCSRPGYRDSSSWYRRSRKGRCMRALHSLPSHWCSPLALHFTLGTVVRTYTNPNPKIANTCTLCLVDIFNPHTIGIGAATIIISIIKSDSASAAVAPLVSSQYSIICFALVHAAAGCVPHWKIFAPRNAIVHVTMSTMRNVEYALNVRLMENIRRYKNTTLSLIRPSAKILRMRMICMYSTFSESSGVRDAAPVSGFWSVCVPKKDLDVPVRIRAVMGHITIWRWISRW